MFISTPTWFNPTFIHTFPTHLQQIYSRVKQEGTQCVNNVPFYALVTTTAGPKPRSPGGKSFTAGVSQRCGAGQSVDCRETTSCSQADLRKAGMATLPWQRCGRCWSLSTQRGESQLGGPTHFRAQSCELRAEPYKV